MPVETPGGGFSRLSMVGSDLRTGENDSLLIDIALRNDGLEEIHAPALVIVYTIDPNAVGILNSELCFIALHLPGRNPLYGFDYSDLIPDSVLSPGETSAAKTWIFHDPGLASFSFDADIESSVATDPTTP